MQRFTLAELRMISEALDNYAMGFEDVPDGERDDLTQQKLRIINAAGDKVQQRISRAKRAADRRLDASDRRLNERVAARRVDPIERMECEPANVWNPAEHGEGFPA